MSHKSFLPVSNHEHHVNKNEQRLIFCYDFFRLEFCFEKEDLESSITCWSGGLILPLFLVSTADTGITTSQGNDSVLQWDCKLHHLQGIK